MLSRCLRCAHIAFFKGEIKLSVHCVNQRDDEVFYDARVSRGQRVLSSFIILALVTLTKSLCTETKVSVSSRKSEAADTSETSWEQKYETEQEVFTFWAEVKLSSHLSSHKPETG